jgi:hypothetical protein
VSGIALNRGSLGDIAPWFGTLGVGASGVGVVSKALARRLFGVLIGLKDRIASPIALPILGDGLSLPAPIIAPRPKLIAPSVKSPAS